MTSAFDRACEIWRSPAITPRQFANAIESHNKEALDELALERQRRERDTIFYLEEIERVKRLAIDLHSRREKLHSSEVGRLKLANQSLCVLLALTVSGLLFLALTH